jgi:hypothetical protein
VLPELSSVIRLALPFRSTLGSIALTRPLALIAKGHTAHPRHDTENVVVGRIHIDLGRLVRANRVVGQREVERGVVNAGEVASAAGLVVLGVEGERVNVDADRGDIRVVLEGLDQVEVGTLTLGEAIVAVELDLRRNRGVLACKTLDAGDRVAGLERRAVEPVGEVERLLALVAIHRGVAGREGVTLGDPDKLLARVVEGHLDLVRTGGDGLGARELELLNEILVRDLREAATLLRVEVDVVDIERGRNEARGVDAIVDVRHVGPAELLEVRELDVDLDLVILERNEGERETGVAVEPELEGDVERILGRAAAVLIRGVGLTAHAVRVAATVGADLGERVDELGDVANHLGVAGLLARGAGELVPDVEPLAIVLVDLLPANLDLNVVHELVTDPVEPAELGTTDIRRANRDRGESGLEVDTVDQIAVTGDRAGNTLAKVGNTVEGLLNGLHGEVRMATVELLKERNLRVRREVDILGTIGDELH